MSPDQLVRRLNESAKFMEQEKAVFMPGVLREAAAQIVWANIPPQPAPAGWNTLENVR